MDAKGHEQPLTVDRIPRPEIRDPRFCGTVDGGRRTVRLSCFVSWVSLLGCSLLVWEHVDEEAYAFLCAFIIRYGGIQAFAYFENR